MPRKGKGNGAFAGKTHICLVWDETGSIGQHGMTEAAKDALHEQVQAAQKGQDVKLTLWLFGTQYEGGSRLVWKAEDPNTVDAKDANYKPQYGTPLYDAVGQAITNLAPSVPDTDRALVCIFTDGEENSSREFTQERVAGLIAEKEALGNWTFAFSAAGFDQWETERMAAAMNIHAGSTQSSPASPVGMRSTSDAMAMGTSSYLSSPQAQSVSFYEDAKHAAKEEEKKVKKPKAKTPR